MGIPVVMKRRVGHTRAYLFSNEREFGVPFGIVLSSIGSCWKGPWNGRINGSLNQFMML